MNIATGTGPLRYWRRLRFASGLHLTRCCLFPSQGPLPVPTSFLSPPGTRSARCAHTCAHPPPSATFRGGSQDPGRGAGDSSGPVPAPRASPRGAPSLPAPPAVSPGSGRGGGGDRCAPRPGREVPAGEQRRTKAAGAPSGSPRLPGGRRCLPRAGGVAPRLRRPRWRCRAEALAGRSPPAARPPAPPPRPAGCAHGEHGGGGGAGHST